MITTILVLIWLSAVPATLFPIVYAIVAPWYKSGVGRSMMAQSVSIALLIDTTLWLHYHPLDSIQTAFLVDGAGFGFAAVCMWFLLIQLVKTQLKKRK